MLHTTWSVLGDGLVHGSSWYMADVCPVVHAGGSPSYSNIRTTTATTALTARCLLPLVLVYLCFPLVLGQSIRADDPLDFIWTSTQPTQCAEYEFFWEGGTPPFELQIAPVDNSVQPDIWVNIHNQSLIWTTDFPGGTALSLLLTDAVMSVTMNTGPIVVQPSDNDTCIPVRGTNPVTTVGIPLSSSTSSSVASSSPSSTSLTTLASHSESSPFSTTSVHFTTRTSAEGRTSSSYRPSPLNSPSPLSSFASSSSAPSVVATLASSSTPSPISSVAFSDVPTVAGGVGSRRGNRSGVLAGISIGVVAFLLLLAALVVYFGRRRSSRSQSPPLDDDDPFASTPVPPHTSASDFSVMRERRYSTPSPFTHSSQAFSATSSAGRARYCEGEAMLALRPELTSNGRTDGAPTPILDSRASPALDGASVSHCPSRAPTKTWCGESSARSETPVDALLPQSPVVGHEGSADTLSRAGTPRTAVDGGVRLAGGPLDGAVDDTDDLETLPPPYQRY